MVSKFQEANLLLRTGKLEEAVAAYRAATAENTSFYPAYQNLGETLWKLGRLDEAIAAFRQAVVLNPGGVWGVYKLGELLRLRGEFEEAAGYLRRAVELKSDVAEFHLGLGAALVQLGQLSEGEGCLRRVLQFSTSSIPTVSLAEAYYFLGVIKSEQQQGAEAVDWYRRGWEIHPGSVDCGLALAKALGKLGRWSEAVDCYRQVAALSESGEVLFALGKALAELQRWEEAIAEYQGAIALGFVGAEVRHHLGYAFNQLGRYEEAVVELRQVLEVNPKSAQVRHQLGYALMQLGRLREAALELRKAVELHPGSAVVWQQLGDVLRELGEREEAIACYRKVIAKKEETAYAKNSLKTDNSKPSTHHNFFKPVNFSAQALGEKMWGGYSRYALPALEEIKHDLTASNNQRSQAAWSLACWYYVEGDYQRCLENAELITIIQKNPDKKSLLATIQCLIKLNRIEQADQSLDFAVKMLGEQTDFLLLKASTQRLIYSAVGNESKASSLQLDYINKVYEQVGLSSIELKDPSQPLHFSNIVSNAKAKTTDQKVKVSVIMPAYNAEKTIHIALESLLAQTWKNLEIIVVDDCSSDSTREVVEGYVRQDSRIKLIAKEVNEGAYPTRNYGLSAATGDLIMVHDSDDWSHPKKIEYQIEAMYRQNSCVGVMSHWLRVDENLIVVGTWKPKDRLFDLNFSSLMFKKSVLDKVGGWDAVRVSGDAEFRTRLEKFYGSKSAIHKISKEVILSFGLSREGSLTQMKSTHVRTVDFGLRWHYQDAYNYWHSQPDFQVSTKLCEVGKNFPVVLGNQIKKSKIGFYDFIAISDFSLKGGAFVSTLNYIVAACRLGMKVAVIHWRKYELKPQSLNDRLYDVCVQYGVEILTPGDEAKASFVMIGYTAILHYQLDYFPNISTKRLIVIVNQFTSRLVDGSDPQYDPYIARANLRSMFGQEGDWIPISLWVKRLMSEDQRYPKPYPNPWYPMIDTDQWCKQKLRWRGREREQPVVGRHGRDAYTKWPREITALKQAYGVNQHWKVRFLGGAKIAIDLLGEQPKNWQIIPFDSVNVQEFLEDLDFFVHYPHEDYIEEFGRAIMEAMAVGIPVILPDQFRETFGHSALYARPEKVSSVVDQLWLDENRYIERARIGREFVEANCNLRGFADRISKLEKQ